MLIPSLYNKVYLDPDWDECDKLGQERWDTLRLLTVHQKDSELLCVASGYGHTHTTMVHNLRTLPQYKRWLDTVDYIMFHENGNYFVNMCGHTDRKDDEHMPVDQLHRFFDNPILQQLRDLVQTHKDHRYA